MQKKRYTIHPTDDGRYYIQDGVTGLRILWLDKKGVANTACRHFNKTHKANVSKTD